MTGINLLKKRYLQPTKEIIETNIQTKILFELFSIRFF